MLEEDFTGVLSSTVVNNGVLEIKERFSAWAERLLSYFGNEEMTSVFITTEVQNNGGVQTALAPIERRPLSGQSPAADRDASIGGSGDERFA